MSSMGPASEIQADRASQAAKRSEQKQKSAKLLEDAADAAQKRADEDKQKALLLEEEDKKKKRAKFGGRGVPQMENLGESQAGIGKSLLGG